MAKIDQDPTALKRLVLSRYYLGLAVDHGKSLREVDVFSAVNLLHEAVETFLVAAAAHVNAPIGPKEEFVGYLNKVDSKIAPLQLPFRSKLIRLNKARIMAKHDSVVPDRSELPGFITTIREFLEEASILVFATDFRAVSLIDALPQNSQRDFLKEAQTAFENKDYANTLIACRKAIYLEYEKYYDVGQFINDSGGLLAAYISKVPFHARSRDYITKNVSEPTDYIVLDHSKIDSELVKNGLDSHQFWNIWRLTPRVYLTDNERWIIRHEPDKVSGPLVEENASYVIENTVDHFVALARVRARQRMVGSGNWTVTSGSSGARLFAKASESSELKDTIPPGTTLSVDGATEALDDRTKIFWKVISSYTSMDKWYYGYAPQEELRFS